MENKKGLLKWFALAVGTLLGISHFSMIGLLVNRKTLPEINLPVGPYTSYEVRAGHEGYEIKYRANDPKVLTVEKDINEKAGFLGLGNNKIKVKEQFIMDSKGGSSNEKKLSAAQVECIKAAGGGEQTGRLVGGSVGTVVAKPLATVPIVGWVLAGAATMMGMNEGAETGGNMAQDLSDACQDEELTK